MQNGEAQNFTQDMNGFTLVIKIEFITQASRAERFILDTDKSYALDHK